MAGVIINTNPMKSKMGGDRYGELKIFSSAKLKSIPVIVKINIDIPKTIKFILLK